MTNTRWSVPKRKAATEIARGSLPVSDSDRVRLLSNTLVTLRTEEDAVREISKLWREAQEKFLTIGRYLVRAKQQFRGEYERVILPQLPFGRQVAFQLRTVATAVEGGKIGEEVLPRSYSTAYSLVTLQPEHLALARDRNLVRHDVARSEIEAFRRELRCSLSTPAWTALDEERRNLTKEVARLHRRITEIDAELAAQPRDSREQAA